MKKYIIIGGVVVVLLVGTIWLIRADISMSNPFLDGQKEEAVVGDLVIPVTATGTVEAAKLIEIKCKASGEVANIPVVQGQIVQEGDVLVELDPVDEKRNVEAREAELTRAQSALEKAKINLANYTQDLPLLTKLAEARLKDASARLEDAAFRWDRVKGYMERDVANDAEAVATRTAWESTQASKDLAEAELLRARNNEDILIQVAKEDVKQVEAAMVAAQKALDEATLRREETVVRARSDGMVYSILVREHQMIQSGTMSLTGGTPLMYLADTSAMFVMAQIDEADIGAIRSIAPAHAQPGKSRKHKEDYYQRYAARVVDAAANAVAEEEGGAPDAEGTDSAPVTTGPAEVDPAAAELEAEMLGLPVDVTVEAYRSEKYQGVIERILPEPQRVNNAIAFKVRIRLVGEDLEKLMGLQADLSFTTEKKEGVVKVKNEALYSEGRACFVWVPVPGKPRDEEKIPVEIGTTDGTFTEITSGLEAGDEIFVKRPKKTEAEKQKTE
ncbi:MAG: biotin/lipoyl-binding protein [Planctomycetota bacterium]